jgi:hypothetical protein
MGFLRGSMLDLDISWDVSGMINLIERVHDYCGFGSPLSGIEVGL